LLSLFNGNVRLLAAMLTKLFSFESADFVPCLDSLAGETARKHDDAVTAHALLVSDLNV
jgi:hypothetical protein